MTIPKSAPVIRTFDYALDEPRTMAYHDWIAANVNGKVVCELGAGSGILTYLCIKYGATKVYCYENNKRVIDWLKRFFASETKVEIVEEDITTATFPTADIYLHENIGSNVYMENILSMYTNLKSQGLEDKTYPNKIKIQYGTYTGESQLHRYNKSSTYITDTFTNSNVLSFFNECPMEDKILPYTWHNMTHDQSAMTFNGTLYDGDLKDLTRYTDSDANSQYLFWEVSFDGSYPISNWKFRNHWNIIKAGDNCMDIMDSSVMTYTVKEV